MSTEVISREKVATNGSAHVEGHKVTLDNTPKTVVTETTVEKKKGLFRRILPFLFLGLLLVGGYYAWNLIQFNKVHEETDDAQVDADISPIIPRVAGYVTAINAKENDRVDSNAVLVTLDAQDLQLKIANAQAALKNAQAAVASATAAATAAKANVATSDVARRKAAADLQRDLTLLKGNAITQEQVDAARAAAESTQAQYAAVQDQAAAALSQVAVAQAQVAQRQNDIQNAQLQTSYATIVSPVSGIVSKKNVEIGQYVQPGQPLMAVTQGDVWLNANFKETQIGKIHPGQQAEFSVDAYPGATLHAIVQSISPATGAKFALLPPDNASGNYVKVTQRVPVKLLVNTADQAKYPLRPGMSVDVTVATGK